MQQRMAAAEQLLLLQPKGLYGQQLSTLFNNKLQQLQERILQKVREHLLDGNHGKLRDITVAVEDLQLLQDLDACFAKRRGADPGAQSCEGARPRVRTLDFRLRVQPSRGCVVSEELPCQLRGSRRFECQVQCVSGNLFGRVPHHNEATHQGRC